MFSTRLLGFFGVFGICALLNLANVLYLTQWVKESFAVAKVDSAAAVASEQCLGFWVLLKDFFRWVHIKTTIAFALYRVGNRRLHIFLLSLLVLCTMGPIYGGFVDHCFWRQLCLIDL